MDQWKYDLIQEDFAEFKNVVPQLSDQVKRILKDTELTDFKRRPSSLKKSSSSLSLQNLLSPDETARKEHSEFVTGANTRFASMRYCKKSCARQTRS